MNASLPLSTRPASSTLQRGGPDRRRSLLRQIALRDLALDRMRQGLCVFDKQQRLLLFNRRYAEMSGVRPDQLWVGMSLRDLVDLRYKAGTGLDISPDQFIASRDRLEITDPVLDAEITLRNGRVHAIHRELLPDGTWVSTSDDVTERRQAEEHVRHMAHHDALTGLPNRVLFSTCLERTLARLRSETGLPDHREGPRAEDWLVAVLFLDLDRFKDVNDSLGHAAGDALLQVTAKRIGHCLGAGDVLARLGGDEFAILLDERIRTAEQAMEVARRVISAASAPCVLDGQEVLIGTSVGIALCGRGDHGADPALLLRQADLALYQAKARGRGTCCFFQVGMHAELQRRREMERDLRQALAEGGLEVHFQPLVAQASRRIVGIEALARWRHARYGLVPPAEFIPLAESAGLIGELGAWVLRTACARAARWKGLVLAVNLSPEQVRAPGLVDLVTTVLAQTGLEPTRLELEITESLLLHDTTATVATLGRLRALGVGIVLDDFGTGYSSLSYLRRFPFNKLKVDRSFVAGLDADAGAYAIVQSVVALGRSLDMRVVIEGIETEAQFDVVRAMGCDEVQGYLLGYPCTAEAFDALLAASGGPRASGALACRSHQGSSPGRLRPEAARPGTDRLPDLPALVEQARPDGAFERA